MREIKFRGRENDERYGFRWVYGDLTHSFGSVLVAGRIVEEFTVGQFTGMKDCEGREIYEGDVIQVVTKNPYWAFKKNYDVYWDLDGFCLEGEPLYYWFKLHDLKVIGNVHDSPELLEATHD